MVVCTIGDLLLIGDRVGATNDGTLPEMVRASGDPARLQKGISSIVDMLTVKLDIILW